MHNDTILDTILTNCVLDEEGCCYPQHKDSRPLPCYLIWCGSGLPRLQTFVRALPAKNINFASVGTQFNYQLY
jgi:hypothetical protein